MPSRNSQIRELERKRQRLERGEKQKAKLEKAQIQLRLKLSKCSFEKTAEAILYQIFSFLTEREHWNLSSSSHKMKNISRSPHASLQQIEVSLDTDSKVEEYLLQFQPQKLTLPFNKWIGNAETTQVSKMFKLDRLRELTFTNNGAFFNPQRHRNTQLAWTSQLTCLTSLVKMKIPDGYFEALPHLPCSLTHLHLSGTPATLFPSISAEILHRLFNSSSLSALQVLKLPKNRYYPRTILNAGTVFPALRELSFGYFGGTDPQNRDLSPLQFAINLESLSIGVDSIETIPQWETLALTTSLRRLTVFIYNRVTIPDTLFAGLSKVTQLTYLKLVPHSVPCKTDISAVIRGLTQNDNSNREILAEKDSIPTIPNGILPHLDTLLIDEDFQLPNATCLSVFPALTELRLPTSTSVFPDVYQLPRLHTLHTVGGPALEHYKDQVRSVVCRFFLPAHRTAEMLPILSKMRQLTTLKLHSRFALPNKDNDNWPVADLFRRFLPPTAQIEIDTSIEHELYNLG